MAVCGWCGTELPWRLDGRETRRYCSHTCRQVAYIARLTPVALAALLARKAERRKQPRTKE